MFSEEGWAGGSQDVDLSQLPVRVAGLWFGAGLQHHPVVQRGGAAERRATGEAKVFTPRFGDSSSSSSPPPPLLFLFLSCRLNKTEEFLLTLPDNLLLMFSVSSFQFFIIRGKN